MTQSIIGFRGPNNVPVINRNAVQIDDICSDLIRYETLDKIKQKYSITDKELFACVEKYTDKTNHASDFVEMMCETVNNEMHVETVGLSDWVFLKCLLRGKGLHPKLRRTDTLYAKGAESYIVECFKQVMNDDDSFMDSDIHRIMFAGFEQACGKVTKESAPELLQLLGYDLHQ